MKNYEKKPFLEIMVRPSYILVDEFVEMANFIKEHKPYDYEIKGYKIIEDFYSCIAPVSYSRRVLLSTGNTEDEIQFFLNYSLDEFIDRTDPLAKDQTNFVVMRSKNDWCEWTIANRPEVVEHFQKLRS
jgi:hypothetical protein